MTRPLFSLPREARRNAAAWSVGRRVRVTANTLREPKRSHLTHTYEGTVLALAVPNVGTMADVLVLNDRGACYWPVAISLATIIAIEEI